MNWKQATDAQLHEIIFNDKECELKHKWQALHEMRRRNGQHKPNALQARRDRNN
jgi:hypothetical protein